MNIFKKIKIFIAKFVAEKSAKNIFYINGPENLPPPLSKDEEEKAFALLEEGSTEAKNILQRVSSSKNAQAQKTQAQEHQQNLERKNSSLAQRLFL